jgi:hypothetical protein
LQLPAHVVAVLDDRYYLAVGSIQQAPCTGREMRFGSRLAYVCYLRPVDPDALIARTVQFNQRGENDRPSQYGLCVGRSQNVWLFSFCTFFS